VPNACVATVTAIDVHRVLPHLDANAKLLEGRHDRHQVFRAHRLDRHVAAGDRGHADEAADLDVIAADRPLAAVQLAHARDAQHVRLDAFDVRAEGDEEATQVLHVRLARGVADHGLAGRGDGRHHRVLRRHHARLVEEDVRAAQPVGRHLVDRAAHVDGRTELGEGMDVRVEAASPDHVSARRRHRRLAEAREQRAGQQERRPDLRAERDVGRVLVDAARVDVHLVRSGPARVGAEIAEQLEHRVDVADARHVGEHDGLVGEQARGEDRQRAVLVSCGANATAERVRALDDEGVRERGSDCHGGLC
jgi:hypothetical protein